MSKYDRYIFLPSFSLEPNKVTSYNSVFIRDREKNEIRSIHDLKSKRALGHESTKTETSIVRKAHNFTISDNAYRTLKRRINWLYYLSKSKQVTTYTGKNIYNFKMAFITLTLPSKQRTCTKDVTNQLLNPFLIELRRITKMENYVWRLEFQENGNAHYHLVTDTYVDYLLIRRLWNRILKNNGYIKPYQEKFSKLNLSEYNKLTNPQGKTEFKIIAQRYAKGKAENWEQPPSVDVKSVISNNAISNYISKYFSKTDEKKPLKNEHDNAENSENLRLWFCSRSLSKLKSISGFCEAVLYDIFALVSYAEKKRKVISKFAITTYFDITSIQGKARKFISMLLKDYSIKQGYIPAKT